MVFVTRLQRQIFPADVYTPLQNNPCVFGLKGWEVLPLRAVDGVVRMDFDEHATGVNFCHGLFILIIFSFILFFMTN